jgi:formylmethanofuran dehydrogenase subunit C
MALTLTRRESSLIPLEVFGLTPDRLVGLLTDDVARLTVRHGNRVEDVGAHFQVTGRIDAEDRSIEFEGDCSTVKGIGAGMTDGFVEASSVGMHAGAKMTGGHLWVRMAGDWLGAEMTGGHVFVSGNAGDSVGAAYPGSRRGMRGGKIHIQGDAGDKVGLLMRRGLIAVGGRVGEFCGASMIAGTILAKCGVGPRFGAGMKRGTVFTFGPEPEWPPGFVYACDFRPAFAEVQRKEMASVFGPPVESVRLYRGDLSTGGRGEIWHIPSRPS